MPYKSLSRTSRSGYSTSESRSVRVPVHLQGASPRGQYSYTRVRPRCTCSPLHTSSRMVAWAPHALCCSAGSGSTRAALRCGPSTSVSNLALLRLYVGGGACLASRSITIARGRRASALIGPKNRLWAMLHGGRSWTGPLYARRSTARPKVS